MQSKSRAGIEQEQELSRSRRRSRKRSRRSRRRSRSRSGAEQEQEEQEEQQSRRRGRRRSRTAAAPTQALAPQIARGLQIREDGTCGGKWVGLGPTPRSAALFLAGWPTANQATALCLSFLLCTRGQRMGLLGNLTTNTSQVCGHRVPGTCSVLRNWQREGFKVTQ